MRRDSWFAILAFGLAACRSPAAKTEDPAPSDSPLPILLKLIKSEDWSDRERGAQALGAFGSKEKSVIESLVKCLKDDKPNVRYLSMLALLELGVNDKSVLATIEKALSDKEVPALSGEHVLLEYPRLERIGPRAKLLVPFLIAILKDQDSEQRFSAIGMLGYIGSGARDAAPLLVGIVADPKERPLVRRMAALSLIDIRSSDQAVFDGLKAALEDHEAGVRVSAAHALIMTDPRNKDASKLLVDTLKSDSIVHRRLSANVLRSIGPSAEPATEILAEITRDETQEGNLRWLAVQALGSIGGRGAAASVPALTETLKSKDTLVRAHAARALVKVDPTQCDKAIPLLIEMLKDKNSDVRKVSAEALGEIGVPAKDATPSLADALDDKNPRVATKAAAAIYRIDAKNKDAVPALVGFLKKKDEFGLFPRLAIKELEQIGPNAKAACPDLIKLLEDGDDYVCVEAAAALGKILGTRP